VIRDNQINLGFSKPICFQVKNRQTDRQTNEQTGETCNVAVALNSLAAQEHVCSNVLAPDCAAIKRLVKEEEQIQKKMTKCERV